jgi:hypothetical protein
MNKISYIFRISVAFGLTAVGLVALLASLVAGVVSAYSLKWALGMAPESPIINTVAGWVTWE